MASKNGMTLRVDKSGRIVLPKHLREDLGIQREAELEITPEAGGIFVRVATGESALIKIDGIWVHRGASLPGTNWDKAVEEVREARMASVLKHDR